MNSETLAMALSRMESLAAQYGLHIEHVPSSSEQGLGAFDLVDTKTGRIVNRGIQLDALEPRLERLAKQEADHAAAHALGEQIGQRIADIFVDALSEYAKELQQQAENHAKVITFPNKKQED